MSREEAKNEKDNFLSQIALANSAAANGTWVLLLLCDLGLGLLPSSV